jgi:hypothetical protein
MCCVGLCKVLVEVLGEAAWLFVGMVFSVGNIV